MRNYSTMLGRFFRIFFCLFFGFVLLFLTFQIHMLFYVIKVCCFVYKRSKEVIAHILQY